MIRCRTCGHLNEDGDTFCGNDGEILKHVGEYVAEDGSGSVATMPASAPAPVPTPAPSPPVAPAPPRLPAPSAPPPSSGGPPPFRPPAPPPSSGPRGSATAPPLPPPPPPQFSGSPSAAPAYTGVPGAPPPIPTVQVSEHSYEDRPTDEPPPPEPVAEAPKRKEKLNPGDLICGQCGRGNAPTNNFCRSCGATLAEAETVPELPWWKRIFRRRPKPAMKAGERPPQRVRNGSPTALFRRVGTALVAAFAVVMVVASLLPGPNPVKKAQQDLYDRIRSIVAPEYEPVKPILAEASSSAPGTSPEMAIDGADNTWWAEGNPSLGEGEQITLTFSAPTDIAKVIVTPGTTREEEQFLTEPRPKTLFLSFSGGSTTTIRLEDKVDYQSFDVDAEGATSVQVRILEVFESRVGTSTSIAEIEFFTPK